MNNPEKLATQGTQYEEKPNKSITQYVLDTKDDSEAVNHAEGSK